MGASTTARVVWRMAVGLPAIACLAATLRAASAAGCRYEAQGNGRVTEIVDSRTFRLHDGREVRLAGIEVPAVQTAPDLLAALIIGRQVSLHGDSDMPDRYGKQPAFVYLDSSSSSVQSQMLAQGAALASATATDKDCVAELASAEAAARRAKRGVWRNADVIKNTESPGDILADVGRFAVVEGTVLSVRQAGATTYINFGRNWTQDFAVTISRRMMATLEAAGMAPKSFERRRIRIRGWVERRGGPRIEVLRVGQIEVVVDN